MKYWFAVMTAALTILFAVPVFAHAELDHCTPAVGSRVAAAPTQVVCVTTDELDTKLSTITVFDATKIQIDKGDGRVDLNDADRKTLIVSLDPSKLKEGVYTVTWHVVAVDDRAISDGTFQFIVGNVAATPAPTTLIVTETNADATPTLTTAAAAAIPAATTSAPAVPTPAARTVPIDPNASTRTGLEQYGPWLLIGSVGVGILLVVIGGRVMRTK